jgi:hypothetical protein
VLKQQHQPQEQQEQQEQHVPAQPTALLDHQQDQVAVQDQEEEQPYAKEINLYLTKIL